MLHTLLGFFATLYATMPVLIWMGTLGFLVVLAVTLTTLGLCRASGQADERTERMAAECSAQLR